MCMHLIYLYGLSRHADGQHFSAWNNFTLSININEAQWDISTHVDSMSGPIQPLIVERQEVRHVDSLYGSDQVCCKAFPQET